MSASLSVLETLRTVLDSFSGYIANNEPDEVVWVHEPLTDSGALTFKSNSVTIYTITITRISQNWTATLA